ncbi:unnamed protein product [Caenorhabditis bovis]|uniref:G-protein coupled receptors family 1 profile domain-containing protein n=1 Tax=Caenorhabditis bovis TaxID=2654633 RepID=A0A8S1F677_9PELO|nr:unnamed protein product [Caenorhabditis bovis]
MDIASSTAIIPVARINETLVTEPAGDDASRVTLKLALVISYLVLFIVGTVGNGTVILMIINVLSSMSKNASTGKRKVNSNTSHVFIYVLGQWLFGMAMCKVYWFGESVNKLLSSFLMTVLSWDRYMAVCSPVKSMKIRSNATAMKVLIACTSLATILLLPVLIEARVFKIDKLLMIPLEDGSVELEKSDRAGTTMRKCMFDAGATFTLYTFVIGFALPAVLIIIFYVKVIFALQKSSRNVRVTRGTTMKPDGSSSRVKKVTKRIVAVILFYFLCWTPQWTLNIMTQFNLIRVSWMTPALSAMFFVAHLLVCFNSAANPILYAYINRELRNQHVMAMHRKRHSVIQDQTKIAQKISRQSRHSDVSATILGKFNEQHSNDRKLIHRIGDILASILRLKKSDQTRLASINIDVPSSVSDESRENEDDYL